MKNSYVIGENVDFVPIEIKDIDEALQFQFEIVNGMNNKEWYMPCTRRDFMMSIESRGDTYFLKHDNKLIGLVVAICDASEKLKDYKLENNNVMLIDGVMVKKEYRGHHLQKQALKLLEKRAKELGLDGIVATVHINNIYSKNNFMASGYKIDHLDFLYGGERLVLVKDIN